MDLIFVAIHRVEIAWGRYLGVHGPQDKGEGQEQRNYGKHGESNRR
jgi:hypothetical protein